MDLNNGTQQKKKGGKEEERQKYWSLTLQDPVDHSTAEGDREQQERMENWTPWFDF